MITGDAKSKFEEFVQDQKDDENVQLTKSEIENYFRLNVAAAQFFSKYTGDLTPYNVEVSVTVRGASEKKQ